MLGRASMKDTWIFTQPGADKFVRGLKALGKEMSAQKALQVGAEGLGGGVMDG